MAERHVSVDTKAEADQENQLQNSREMDVDDEDIYRCDDEQVEDYHLEDAEDNVAVSAYMERLLGRTIKNRRERTTQQDDSDESADTADLEDNDETPDQDETPDEDGPDADQQQPNSPSIPEPTQEDESDVEQSEETEPPAEADSDLSRSQDKLALRASMDSMRKVANLSARTAIKKYGRKRLRSTVLVKGIVTIVMLTIAIALFLWDFWSQHSLKTYAWIVGGIGLLFAFEFAKSTLLIHRQMSFKKAKNRPIQIEAGQSDVNEAQQS